MPFTRASLAALGNVGPDVYSQTGVNSSDAANAGLYAPSMQGNRLHGVSELDYNISVTQYFPVLDGVGSATVSFAHRGDFYTDIWNREAQKVDDADFIDIKINLASFSRHACGADFFIRSDFI